VNSKAAYAVGAAVLFAFALFLVRSQTPKKAVLDAGPATPAPLPPEPALPPGEEPLPTQWKCPAKPEAWFGRQAQSEVIETEERWNEYLRVSGFKPPAVVDLQRFRAALIPFIGGGGHYRVRYGASRKDGRFILTEFTTTPPPAGEPATEDIVYDCDVFLIPRESGSVELASAKK